MKLLGMVKAPGISPKKWDDPEYGFSHGKPRLEPIFGLGVVGTTVVP
jgi:hypothetical protein